jgi:hypothetical protein
MAQIQGFVVVRTFSQPHEAHLACTALRAAGIEAIVTDTNIVPSTGCIQTRSAA